MQNLRHFYHLCHLNLLTNAHSEVGGINFEVIIAGTPIAPVAINTGVHTTWRLLTLVNI